jgi:hypothetical protein
MIRFQCVSKAALSYGINPHECSHSVSIWVELLLEENGNVGSLYVSKRKY